MFPEPVAAHMQFSAQFELRARGEDLLAAPDDAARQHIMAAQGVWLKTPCAAGGALIDEPLRRRGAAYGFVYILPPPPAASQPQPEDSDEPFSQRST